MPGHVVKITGTSYVPEGAGSPRVETVTGRGAAAAPMQPATGPRVGSHGEDDDRALHDRQVAASLSAITTRTSASCFHARGLQPDSAPSSLKLESTKGRAKPDFADVSRGPATGVSAGSSGDGGGAAGG